MLKVIRVLLGIILVFVIASINGIAGYGYTFGGTFQSAINMMGPEAGKDPRLIVEIAGDGSKKVKPKDALSALRLIASTRLGAFGIFLQIFVWFQLIAGLILIFKNNVGTLLCVFLGLVAAASLVTEIIGAILTSSFGITNALGSVVAILVGIVILSIYRATPKEEFQPTLPNNANEADVSS